MTSSSTRARMSSLRARATIALAVTALVCGAGAGAGQAVASPANSSEQTVTYDGVSVRVPASWPVIRLDGVAGCVRYDQHAVYLGTPTTSTCPAHLVGHTETVQITRVTPSQAAAITSAHRPTAGSDRQILLAGDRLVTITEATDAAAATAIADSLASSAPTMPPLQPEPTSAAPVAAAPAAPSYITKGGGFDACTAASTSAMNAWLASPYRSVNIYIGGINRGCAQPNLTAAWVTTVHTQGWRLIPTYVGLQASCSPYSRRIDPATAAAQGAAAANDAANLLAGLGLAANVGNPVYYDMEAYDISNSGCVLAVKKFVDAWTTQLHSRGYVSGIYGSAGSMMTNLVQWSTDSTFHQPDGIWYAHWDAVNSTTGDAYIPDTLWPHRRIHQYRGDHNETYGGVTINIDSDAVDGATTGGGDRDGDGTRDAADRCPTRLGLSWNWGCPDRIAAVDLSGGLSAKDGLAGSWVAEAGTVRQAYLAGDRIGALLTDGTLIAKDGLTGSWVTELGGVAAAAFSGDNLAVLLTDGTVKTKTGLSGVWVTQTTNATQVFLDGNRLGALLGNGTLVAKDGLAGSWVTQATTVAVAAFAGDNLAIIRTDGTMAAKTALSTAWVNGPTNARQVYLDGNRVGALLADGTLVARDGFTGPWVTQAGSVATAAFAGGSIAVLSTDGTVSARSDLTAAWIGETTNAAEVYLDGIRLGVLRTDGTLIAKDGLGGAWVTQAGSVAQPVFATMNASASAHIISATAPTTLDGCGTVKDTYTIGAPRGVEYLVGGTVVAPGSWPGTGTVTVTARAKAGYVLTGTSAWVLTFTNALCRASVTGAPLSTPTWSVPKASLSWSSTGAPAGTTFTYDVRFRSVTLSPAGVRGYTTPASWLTKTSATTGTLTGTVGAVYQVQARATDSLGTVGPWSPWQTVTMPVDDRDLGFGYTGAWTTGSSTPYYGGTYRSTSAADATVTATAYTDQISVIGAKSPTSGQATVTVDGVVKATIDAYATTAVARQTLATISLPYGSHTVTVTNLATPGRPRLFLDALAFRR